jgi:lipoprotein-anchoring transpeptidase ErfK/SrfK
MRKLMLAVSFCLVLAAVAVLPALADTGTVSTGAGWVWVRSGPGTRFAVTGRVYNGGAVNIVAAVPGQVVSGGNSTWYQIGPGRYVYSGLVRKTGGTTPNPTPTPVPAASGRWIEVILSQQRLIAHDGSSIFMNTLISSGTARYPTVRGTFSIRVKYRSAPMSGPGYYLPAVPHTMYFYGGYAIHGAYWHNNFGHPMSHGCINMRLADAAALFNWASVGTKVVVR